MFEEPQEENEEIKEGNEEENEEFEEEGYVITGLFSHFLQTINPFDGERWAQMSVGWRIYEVIRSPVRFLLLLCIPTVDEDHPTRGWCKLLILLQCLLTPVLWTFAVNGEEKSRGLVLYSVISTL